MDRTKRTGAAQQEERYRLVHVFTVATSVDFLRGQVRYLAQRGVDVHIVAAPEGDLLARFAAAQGAAAHEVPMTRAITPLRDALALYRLWRLLGRLRPTVVNAGTPKGGLLGIVAARMRQIPVRVYQMHGIRAMTARGWQRPVLLATEWLTCRLATRVWCVSNSTRDTAVAAGLCPPEKIVVLGAGSCNGVDAQERFNPARISADEGTRIRHQLGIPATAPLIGFVGRVVQDKGIRELAAAWSSLAAQFPEAHLIILGSPEHQDAVPTATLAALRGDPRVHLLMPVLDPAPYYRTMDLVVLPTYREGLPTVLLEAASMGLPVVATRVDGCVDAVVDGVTGTLVDPYLAQPLSDAVALYLRSPVLRTRHGAEARQRVLRDFVPEQLWARVAELYQMELRKHEPS